MRICSLLPMLPLAAAACAAVLILRAPVRRHDPERGLGRAAARTNRIPLLRAHPLEVSVPGDHHGARHARIRLAPGSGLVRVFALFEARMNALLKEPALP